MTLLHHTRLVLRLVPVVLSLWWADLREPGAAIRILRAVVARSPERHEDRQGGPYRSTAKGPPSRIAVMRRHILAGAAAAWCLAWAVILWRGATLGGALVAALAGSYSLIALTVRDRLEAL